MVTALEVHQAEQRYIELKRLLDAEKSPLDPQQIRAAIRCGERQLEAIKKVLLNLCPELCEQHGLTEEIPY